MKALTYHGPQDVRYESVPDPVLPNERGAVVRVRSAGICGSDLHIYDGHGFAGGTGYSLGHEAVGEVVEVGSAVSRFAPGDRVLAPASVGCGHCGPCGRGVVFLCENFGEGGVYGIGHALGGCQAEAIAVPAADMNLVAIPDGVSDDAGLVLTDNAPTGWYGARLGRIAPGDTVAVVGLGPVGLMAAAAALVMGAAQVLAVDLVASRRARAKALGAIPVEGDPRSEVFALTGGRGADVVIEAVGADATIGLATDLAGRCGRVSVVGINQSSAYTFNMLMAQLKCLEFTIGMCSVQAELPALLPLTTSGRLDPGAIVTHRLPLDAGRDAYALFASRADGVAKVVLDV
ncbi:MAG TPA: alcohol dehydrogenase catalytic domain-containing protein [Acidimicrobiales bacterium]